MDPFTIVLVLFIILCAIASVILRDVLGSVIAFAAYSLGISILWVFLRAPDVGLTEAAVGTGVMSILFLVVIIKTVRPSPEKLFESINTTALLISILLVCVLISTLGALPPVGSSNSPVATSDVTQYYINNSYEEVGVKNSVTAVLAAYRGLDTLGEAVVVFSAGVGVLVIFRREVFYE